MVFNRAVAGRGRAVDRLDHLGDRPADHFLHCRQNRRRRAADLFPIERKEIVLATNYTNGTNAFSKVHQHKSGSESSPA